MPTPNVGMGSGEDFPYQASRAQAACSLPLNVKSLRSVVGDSHAHAERGHGTLYPSSTGRRRTRGSVTFFGVRETFGRGWCSLGRPSHTMVPRRIPLAVTRIRSFADSSRNRHELMG